MLAMGACSAFVFLAFLSATVAFAYPAPPSGSVTTTYFGTPIADPYRTLEKVDAPETKAWVDKETELTESVMRTLPLRDRIRAAFVREMAPASAMVPRSEAASNGFRVIERHDDATGPLVLIAKKGDSERVILDSRALWPHGEETVVSWQMMWGGANVAYATTSGGGGFVRWHTVPVESSQERADVIIGTPDWAPITAARDGGFYYGGYGSEAKRPDAEPIGEKYTVRFHKIGRPQSQDTIIFEAPDHPTWLPYVMSDADGLIVLSAIDGAGKANFLAVRDFGPNALVRMLRPLADATYTYFGIDNGNVLVTTNDRAPRGKLIAINVRKPEIETTIIPESDATLTGVYRSADRLFALELRDGHSELLSYDKTGKDPRDVALPGLGTAALTVYGPAAKTIRYAFSNPTTPPSSYEYDPTTNTSRLITTRKAPFDTSQFITEELFATSADGTRVPVFVAHRKDVVMDGRAPVLLTGYGGFGYNFVPGYTPMSTVWLEQGGVYAIADIRGGGEYGQAWHAAGMLGNKHHVFEDFCAAAELLIAKKFASPSTLGTYGYSGGGLLVGAAEILRPQLFGAVVEAAGPVDVIRGETYGAEAAWVGEVGSPTASAEQFSWLNAYAPLSHMQNGTIYPPTLVMTSENDVRVSPAHSYKFAAALQHAQGSDAPILLSIARNHGHVGGGTLEQRAAPNADAETFLLANLTREAVAK
jgi:prolyl oligopeptidase